jgi:hypothetical protein
MTIRFVLTDFIYLLTAKSIKVRFFIFVIYMALKVPRLNLQGKTFGVKNTLVYPIAGVAALAGAGLFISKYGQNFGFNIGNLFGAPNANAKAAPKAVRVNFNVYPPVIKPFRKIRLQGQFEDANGIPAPVEYGYYAIFENVPAGSNWQQGRLLTSSGIVGQNVGAFRQDIPTDNFRTGPYVVYISNSPIRSDPLQGKQVELQLAGGRPITIG